ncbi:MAG: hypothetical protein A2010_10945 [Nitrospirae bacterium GWD2_57_9]|nr:MAG: hypothetical protein A2010_10945 [Nitrospirae bacterium GWD2_57_9]OGW47705.1 MAG: hypothetical protein A2078_05845 [Nitrospirae bacterium GWC2_57_9]
MKILTLYDGTMQSKAALRYGLRKVREKGGSLTVLQVFQTDLFVDYDAGPRAQDIARAESARHRRDAEAIISAAGNEGISVNVRSEEGEPVEEAARVAESEQPDLVLASPRYKALVRRTSRPVYIIPGTILVPVDSSETVKADRDMICAEARETGSAVLFLGVVPVHLYSSAERDELEQVRKKTASVIKSVQKWLGEQGIKASEVFRAGYPDEEILKAAEEFSVSLIMLPAGGKTPSELAKAAAILLDEPERVKRPVYLMPAMEM